MKSPLNPSAARNAKPLPKALEEQAAKKPSNQEVSWDDLEQRPLVIGITSAKGGVGKSSTAMNLAAYLTQPQGPENISIERKILLVDADDYSIMRARMGVWTQSTSADSLLEDLEKQKIWSFKDTQKHLVTHKKVPGLYVLPAKHEDSDWSPGDYQRLFKDLSKHFLAIVVDLGSELASTNHQYWANKADTLFWMASPDVTSLAANGKVIARFPRHGRRNQLVMIDDGYKADIMVQKTLPTFPVKDVHYLGYYNKEIIQANNKAEFFALTSAGIKYKAKLSQMQAKAFNLGYR